MPHGFTRPAFPYKAVILQSSGASESNDVATATSGTTVANAAGTNTKGAYTTIITSLANATYGLDVEIHNVASSGVATGVLLDITYNDGSDHIILPDINAGYAPGGIAQSDGAKRFCFRGLNLAAGVLLKARTATQVNNQSTLVLTVYTINRSRVLSITDNNWVAYGVDAANSRGTTCPWGNAAFGAWTQIGTTAQNHNLWSFGADMLGSNAVAQNLWVAQIGIGPNASSVTIMGNFSGRNGTAESLESYSPEIEYPSTSGDKVWARIAGTIAAGNMGVIIYGGG